MRTVRVGAEPDLPAFHHAPPFRSRRSPATTRGFVPRGTASLCLFTLQRRPGRCKMQVGCVFHVEPESMRLCRPGLPYARSTWNAESAALAPPLRQPPPYPHRSIKHGKQPQTPFSPRTRPQLTHGPVRPCHPANQRSAWRNRRSSAGRNRPKPRIARRRSHHRRGH